MRSHTVKSVISICTMVTGALCSQGALAMDVSPISSHTSGSLFTIKGSNTVGAILAPEWAKAYLIAKGVSSVSIEPTHIENEFRIIGSNKNLPVSIDIHAHGSSTGFKALKNNSTDLAMSSRAIKQGEAAALAHLGDMTSLSAEHIVAIDGLAIIVNQNNPVTDLTIKQIADIFSGKISNWIEVGGNNSPINLYARDHKSGTWDTFKSLVLEKGNPLSHRAIRFASNNRLSESITQDKIGIGFVGLSSVNGNRALAVSELYTQPLMPLTLNVATEDYPLSRRLFLYTHPTITNPLVKEFLSFVESEKGQDLVGRVGYVSQNPISIKPSIDPEAPNKYVEEVAYAERLSVNFRFSSGSAELDNKSQRDILRVVDYITMPENREKRIKLIGFGDLKQSQSRSLILSKLRATAVKTTLYDYGISTDSVLGFGPYMPIASNLGGGKFKNQRVEVWVYNPKIAELYKPNKREKSKYSRTIGL